MVLLLVAAMPPGVQAKELADLLLAGSGGRYCRA